MIPKITNGGSSFKGAFRYYLHDKGAETSDRVAWVQTANMRTRDPEKAWKMMAYTANAQERLKEASGQSRAGRKLEKPVYAFSLAWHPEQNPTQEHMLDTARKAVETLGLTDHEHVIVAHRDEPQKHVHVIVNRVHPITGLAGDVRNSKRKLSDFAREYEQNDGKVYCKQREQNHKARQKGKSTQYCDPHIVKAWETTDCGKDFVAALEAEGYSLAQGRKRIVIVDPHGKAHNPTRHLKNVKAKDIRARLSDLNLAKLPVAVEPVSPEKAQEEEKARQRIAFEEKARMQTLELREKHQHELEAAELQQTRRVAFTKGRLVKFYGLQRKKDALVALREKIKKASLWNRIIGTTRKDRKTLREHAQVYRKAVHDYKEKLAHATDQGQKTLVDLKSRQEDETRKFEFHLEMQRGAEIDTITRAEPEQERSGGQLSRIFASVQDANAARIEKKLEEDRLKPRFNSYPRDRQ